MHAKHEITLMLENLRSPESTAVDDLLSLVYSEMHQLAAVMLSRERRGHTLAVTDLVHEAYLRLFDSEKLQWQDRRHFFGSAAKAMRRVLVDHARRKNANKRIPKDAFVPLEDSGELFGDLKPPEFIALDDALKDLEKLDPRQAEIVELRYFAGLTESEVAEILNLSRQTVSLDWRSAKLWLRHQLLH